MRKYILFLFLLILNSSVYGSEVPKYEEYIVRADVHFDQASGIYSYEYILINPSSNKNLLWNLSIYVSKDLNSRELSWENLTYGKWYSRHSSEAKKDKVVPIGMDGPQGWTYGIGEDENGKGFASFGSLEDYEIRSGNSIRGLVLTSYGLPIIRAAMLLPGIDYDNLPEEYYGNVELTKQLQDSLTYHTKTIGPTAPPAELKPLEFLDHIISMKHEAYSLGWIKSRGIEQSLDAKLNAARRKLSQGNTNAAKDILNAFVNEVEAQGCESYENCPEGKHLTSEAYALLKYNALYLIERL